MDQATFPTWLRNRRKRLGLTQPQAAELLEVHINTLVRWETGTSTPLAVTMEGVELRFLHRIPIAQITKDHEQ